MPTLRHPVGFRSNRLNMRIEVTHGRSQITDAAGMLHEDVKTVEFHDGLFSTDDPEIVEFLEKRPDVWRADDPHSDLLARFGKEEYARLRKEFLAAEPAPEGTE